MAKAAAAAAAPEGAEGEAPKSKKKLIIIIAAVLMVLILGGGAAAFFLMKGKGADDAHKEEAKQEEPLGPPVFVVMDPFVVNLAEPDTQRYLQIGITYEAKDTKAAEQIKTYTPVIRSRILLVLSSKNVNSLSTIDGKQQLMDELLDLVRVTIKADEKNKDPENGIRDVHFSSFVIQ